MKVRTYQGILLWMACVFGGQLYAQGGSTATQSLTLEVRPITKIAVSSNPNTLIITDALAGADLTSVQDENTTYSVTTNVDNMKIVASISSGMPSGTKLMIRLGSTNGVTRGTTDISTALAPVDVVTGIGRGYDRNQTISYVFAANADVGQIASDSRVITLTLTN